MGVCSARTTLLCGVAAISLASVSGAAWAAEGGAPIGLEEVVVTAERVETTLQRTPISVAVVDDQVLATRGVNTLNQLQNVEPTVNFTTGFLQTTTISIRGVSSVSNAAFGGSAVTVNTDGQYLLASFNGALFDVGRVEVLKGPQGTLYGLNATAGNVNIITNAPELGRFGGRASVQYGNYDALVAEGMLNIPIGDKAALRVSALRNRRDGYRQHPGMSPSDLIDLTAGRVSLLWKPTQALTARLTAEYTDEDYGHQFLQGEIIPPSAANPAGQPPLAYRPNLNPRSWPLNFEGYTFGFQRLVRAQVDYDFGWAHLTYVGGLRYTKQKVFLPNFGTPVQITDFQQTNWARSHQQELRLAGSTDFGTRWQVGAFYLRYAPDNLTNIFNSVTRFHAPRTLPFLHFDNLGILNRNKAIYGQITQSITEQLSVTGGLRYTEVNQVATNRFNMPLVVPTYVGSSGAVIQRSLVDARGKNEFNRTSWRVGVDYQATSANLIYASASTSFKDGGFTPINSYLPEDILAFELGTKNRFFDGRLQLNAAIYAYKYKNQQADSLVVVTPATATTPALSQGSTINVGRSRLNGGEATLLWQATARDQLSLSAAYTDAKYTRFVGGRPIIPLGSVTEIITDLSGNRPPNAPKWILTAGFGHTFDVGDGGELELRADARYSSSYFLYLYNLPGERQGSFMQTDLNATYRAPGGRWEAGAYVRNLEDNNVLSSGRFIVQSGQGIFVYGWTPPRTYGVRIAASF